MVKYSVEMCTGRVRRGDEVLKKFVYFCFRTVVCYGDCWNYLRKVGYKIRRINIASKINLKEEK